MVTIKKSADIISLFPVIFSGFALLYIRYIGANISICYNMIVSQRAKA